MQRLSARLDARATAAFRPSSASQPADDLMHLSAEHRNGVVSSIVAGNANPGVSIHRWTIVGDRGIAILENPGGDLARGFVLKVFGSDGSLRHELAQPPIDGDGRIPPFRRLATRFVHAIRSGGRCRPDFSDGARVAALTDAARQAAKLGTWVGAE
jgi:predicted dehydrogenase